MYLKVTIENEAYCLKSTNHLREALSKWVKTKGNISFGVQRLAFTVFKNESTRR